MAKITLNVNEQSYELDVDPQMPLLWAIRDDLKMTGAKYGCGIGLCGTCTIHMDGVPIRACTTPVSAVQGVKLTTIEGLSKNGEHPVQQAWVELNVPQCGYCQPGQIMSAAALLEKNKAPTNGDIDDAMSGNLCRCGAYQRIRAGIHRAAEIMREGGV